MGDDVNLNTGNPARLGGGADALPSLQDWQSGENLPRGADDLRAYRVHIAHLGMTPAREDEVLAAIWRMMGNFVDRAFGDDPVQHVDDLRRRGEIRRAPVVGSGEAQPQTDAKSLSDAFVKSGDGEGEESP